MATSLSSRIRLGAIIADAIDSSPLILQSSKSSERCLLPCDDADAKVEGQFEISSNKGAIIPQHSLHRMLDLLPMAAFYVLTPWFEIFLKRADIFSSSSRETSVMSLGSFDVMMKSVSWEHILCTNMPENRHYCMELAVHFSKDVICDWMESIYGCYILYSRSPCDPFKSLKTISPLEIIH